MERRVKERLVGAAVLMAAAIILNEMLLDPDRGERAVTAQSSSEATLKTYTIDLNRSPDAAPTTGIDERAPPPEVNLPTSSQPFGVGTTSVEPSENPTSTPQAVPEGNAPRQASQERTASESQAGTMQPTAPPTQSVPSPRELNPPPIASAAAAPISRGWAVQLGSFASRATADRMVKDLSQRQNAFVMPVKSGGSTLYRVRIGPFVERAAADEALREVKGRIANAAVVAHP